MLSYYFCWCPLQSSPGTARSQMTPLSHGVTVANTPKTPITVRTNKTQLQPSVKVVKVFSSAPATSQTRGTSAKPLLQIVPNPQGNIQQQQQGNLATDLTTPKVVAVQSLKAPTRIRIDPSPQQNKVTIQNLVLQSGHKIHLQTPVSQIISSVSNNSPQYQVKTISVQQSQPQPQIRSVSGAVGPTTPVTQNKLPQLISTPLRSPALPASYKPLESLKEVNRQATQATVVSPVSAVMPDAADSITTSPTELRNQVTVSDRYRYIAPSPQTSSAVAASSSVAAAASQPVQTSPAMTAVPVAVQHVTPSQPQVLQVLYYQQSIPVIWSLASIKV